MFRHRTLCCPAIVSVACVALLTGCAAATESAALVAEVGGGGAEAVPEGASGGAGAGDVSFTGGAGGSGAAQHVDNLIANGDFEQGNVLFGSDHAHSPDSGWDQGVYQVGREGKSWNPYWSTAGDHTTGTGLMLLANGKETPDRVWLLEAPIEVMPHTTYYFEAWVMSECCEEDDAAVLSFYANDELLGTRTASGVGSWVGLSTTWDSGSATQVTLKLVNANTLEIGNDFAVDDVFFGLESTIPPPA